MRGLIHGEEKARQVRIPGFMERNSY